MIDSDGFRANVGIVLVNSRGKLFWARRTGMDAWQFPQGGIKKNENPEKAMYRELEEEVGLFPEQVEIMGHTQDWLRYWLPERFIRYNTEPVCIGQKQIWYLLRLLVDESHVNLQHSGNPEFDHWRWVDFWYPLSGVIAFKRDVYEEALKELAPFIPPSFQIPAGLFHLD